jgi:hypothetical protein
MKKNFIITTDEEEFEKILNENGNVILYTFEVDYNNNQHIKNSLNYLFNTSDKYFNENTKFNLYFDGISLRGFDERTVEHKKLNEMFSKENHKKCKQQLFYFNIEKKNIDGLTECYEVLKNAIRELEKKATLPKSKFEYYVLHLNQELPHFHRIFVIE